MRAVPILAAVVGCSAARGPYVDDVAIAIAVRGDPLARDTVGHGQDPALADSLGCGCV